MPKARSRRTTGDLWSRPHVQLQALNVSLLDDDVSDCAADGVQEVRFGQEEAEAQALDGPLDTRSQQLPYRSGVYLHRVVILVLIVLTRHKICDVDFKVR